MNKVSLALALALASLALATTASAAPGGEFSDGTLEVAHLDYLEEGRCENKVFYRPDHVNERLEVKFEGGTPEGLVSGQRVHFRGARRQGNEVVAGLNSDGEVVLEEATVAAVSGARDVLVVLVNFSNASAGCSGEAVTAKLFYNTESNRTIYERSSFGSLTLNDDADGDGSPDVVSVQTGIEYTGGCDYGTWKSAAYSELSSMGISASGYDHVVFVLPQVECGWAGIGWINHRDSMINGKHCNWLTVYPHELGHNLGLAHASQGSSTYGDDSSFMGNPGTSTLCHAPNAAQMGWIGNGSGLVEATAGTHDLAPLFSGGGTQALKVTRPNETQDLYVSYRHASGADVKLASGYSDKVHLHHYSSGYSASDLVATLGLGDTYTDPATGIALTVTGLTAGVGATVSLDVDCVASAPSVSLAPSSQFTGVAGATLDYTVSVTNRSTNCEATTFDTTLTLDGGQTGSATVSVTSGAGSSGALYGFDVDVLAADSPGASASATYGLDTAAPSPVALGGSVNRKNRVSLTWTTATDTGGSGLARYEVFRDGQYLAMTTGTSYADSGTVSGATHEYVVVAVDRAENRSAPSNSVSLTMGTKGGGGGGGGGTKGGGGGKGKNR
jgi:hypothetical protein